MGHADGRDAPGGAWHAATASPAAGAPAFGFGRQQNLKGSVRASSWGPGGTVRGTRLPATRRRAR
jgi:hypothetical protein